MQARLSKHKYPRWVVFVDDLPKNDRGKVDKKLLIEREKRGELSARVTMAEKFLARHTTATLDALLGGKKRAWSRSCRSARPSRTVRTSGSAPTSSSRAAACVRACELLEKKGPLVGVIAPAVSYGVTDCAAGFAGRGLDPGGRAHRVRRARSCDGLLAQRLRHVCLVNNHLEPAHDAAIRAVLAGPRGQGQRRVPADEEVGAHAVAPSSRAARVTPGATRPRS